MTGATAPAGLTRLARLPRLWAALLFLVFLAVASWAFMGRTVHAVRSDVLLALAPAFYGHVSNLALSYLLFAGIGYAWLMFGVRARWIAWLGVAIALGNVVYESFIPVLNTPDPVDAIYGLVGTLVGAGVLFLIGRFGMQPNPAYAPAADGRA